LYCARKQGAMSTLYAFPTAPITGRDLTFKTCKHY
jgi:hypothetical protein